MKSPGFAFFLNFILPGAGLAYIGKWKWGLINFAVVLVVGMLVALLQTGETFETYARYIGYGLAGGSGGLAKHYAVQQNKALESAKGSEKKPEINPPEPPHQQLPL